MRNSRAQIVDKAARVFYRNGYNATGVDMVARSAGITKATLYHHFANKQALMEAVLRHLSEVNRAEYQKAWSKPGLSAEAKLTVLFDTMARAFKDRNFLGCPFINAAGEYSDRNASMRQICEQHYGYITDQLTGFAREAGLRKPRALAEQITALIAGAYSTWFVAGQMQSAVSCKRAAKTLIDQHRRSA